jgi:hypothetical protein
MTVLWRVLEGGKDPAGSAKSGKIEKSQDFRITVYWRVLTEVFPRPGSSLGEKSQKRTSAAEAASADGIFSARLKPCPSSGTLPQRISSFLEDFRHGASTRRSFRYGAIVPSAFDVGSVLPRNNFLLSAPEVFDGNHPR